MRKFGTKSIIVKQEDGEFNIVRKNAAFRDWQYKLNRRDSLPRGKFFKNKKAGRPYFIRDEFWGITSQTSGADEANRKAILANRNILFNLR